MAGQLVVDARGGGDALLHDGRELRDLSAPQAPPETRENKDPARETRVCRDEACFPKESKEPRNCALLRSPAPTRPGQHSSKRFGRIRFRFNDPNVYGVDQSCIKSCPKTIGVLRAAFREK